ncbi:hypothetical protein FFH90_023485 [Pseudomonas sp. ATCC 43928]|uniref:hypothetical protein n=1 Tax=Pseudomonas sp. ATCC 43928 TaxID=676210 RepID=UPI00110E73E3|nr:hypothetical protein [Pseudomonas sp. ATCC 43928]QDV97101.1 hypothetical protein FFH90_023485 [Pseudomonas sp. ATCC 43928]
MICKEMVHHYTTENHHLPLILASGALIPSNAGAAHEPPLLWFSKAQRWEKTATKMVQAEDGLRLLTFAEQLAKFGCVRFSLASDDPRLMNWVDACKYAGITSTARRKLEAVGRKRGGSPIEWFAIAGNVSVTELRLERFDGTHWVDRPPF